MKSPISPNHDDLSLLPGRFARVVTGVATANERHLLSGIWQAPEATRASLTTRMDLTQQSVHRLLSSLHEAGMILFGPLVPPAHKGKPSPQLLLNPRFGCSLGVSLDTDKVGVAVMDFAGGYVTRRFPISGEPVATVLERIDAALTVLLNQLHFTRADVLGIGVSIAGYRMKQGGYNPPELLSQWAGIDLAKVVSDRFALPCWTDNGANTAALSEAMFGLGRRYRHLAYLSFNYGFGGGLISNGALLHGAFGNAGELGMVFTPEEAARRPALGLLLRHLRSAGYDARTIEDLEPLTRPMRPEVTDWIEQVMPQLDRVVNAIAGVADPECIVFGGQIPRSLAEALIERVRFFARPRYGEVNPLPTLEISDVGEEAPAIGAACLPLRALVF